MSVEENEDAKELVVQKKSRERPAMQIYRPPGMRAPSDLASPTSPVPKSTGNNKVESDRASNASSDSRTSSSKGEKEKPKSKIKPQKTEPKKRSFGLKEAEEIIKSLKKLELGKEEPVLNNFINSNLESEVLASSLGSLLTRKAIEEGNKTNQKFVARISALLIECPAGTSFHKSFISSLSQYFDCRDQLRETHSKVWISFLNFLSDVYASVGFEYEGGLVDLLFKVFDYMLQEPVLETLKIEELESMISSMLSIGYDLERNCPDQLGKLKNQIRDAFVEVKEPWARKMIMLLMELSASGWSLPAEANEYYFH